MIQVIITITEVSGGNVQYGVHGLAGADQTPRETAHAQGLEALLAVGIPAIGRKLGAPFATTTNETPNGN
jgi:hypothetical protein